jgi:hypothetical protein
MAMGLQEDINHLQQDIHLNSHTDSQLLEVIHHKVSHHNRHIHLFLLHKHPMELRPSMAFKHNRPNMDRQLRQRWAMIQMSSRPQT